MAILKDAFSAYGQEVDVQNRKRRCICCLLIDSSETMKSCSDTLGQIFPAFLEALSENDYSENIELGVWTFNRRTEEFLPIRELYTFTEQDDPPELHITPRGRTHTGEAVMTVLEAIDSREELLRQTVGAHSYVPMLVTITDGNPNFTDDPAGRAEGEQAWKTACAELHSRIAGGTLRAFAVGIGNQISEENLSLLAGGSAAGNTRPLRTQEDFRRLFDMIAGLFITASSGAVLRPEYYVATP